jgi:transcriptional regulator with XRE-family HTH domain
MPNERLRAALLQKGMTPGQLAEAVKVDPKSVERWITQGREPYRKTRWAVATLLGVEESFLWPDALSPAQVAAAAESEVVTVYPHRWAVPRDAWRQMYETAEEDIGVLVYSGLFLAEDTGLLTLLATKARAGARVRILLGDPESPALTARGTDESEDPAVLAGRARNSAALFRRALRDAPGAEIRLHGTVLYNSIYRADDQLLVNTHIYGTFATHAPVLHLRRLAGGDLVTTYLESFARVWDGARPLA